MYSEPKEFDENLFVIVNHLNQGYCFFHDVKFVLISFSIVFDTLPFDQSEVKPTEVLSPYLPLTAVSVAQLNLMVCVKAKKTNSNALILTCANMGM